MLVVAGRVVKSNLRIKVWKSKNRFEKIDINMSLPALFRNVFRDD